MKRLLLVLLISSCALAQSTNIPKFGVTYTAVQVTLSFSPDGAVNANNDASVTITPVPADATVKYCKDTANTCDPSAGTAGTSATVTADGATTYLRAIGTKGGYTDSDVKSASYTYTVANPTYSHGTSYSGGAITDLSMNTTTSSGTVHYTSGASSPSDPTCASPAYSTPLTPAAGTTYYKAIACKSNYTASSIVPATYTISAASPSIDTTNAKAQNDATPGTSNTVASFVVDNGTNCPNPILLAFLAFGGYTTSDPSPTVGWPVGTALTATTAYSDGYYFTLKPYWKAAPTPGTNTLTVTTAASISMPAVVATACNAPNTPSWQTHANVSAGTITATRTTASGDLMIFCASEGAAETWNTPTTNSGNAIAVLGGSAVLASFDSTVNMECAYTTASGASTSITLSNTPGTKYPVGVSVVIPK